MTMTKTTDLVPGMLVRLPMGGIVRTVDRVEPSGFLNSRKEALYNVIWAEGSTPEWSGGNSGAASSEWDTLTECSWNAGGDPASGCDELVNDVGDLCPTHATSAAALGV